MPTDLFDRIPAAELNDDELAERVVGYASQIAALTARMLVYLAEFDEREAWMHDGIASCAHWLVWRAGISLRTAQEHVRIARSLRELPLIHDEFGLGRLSYSKVRALTRVATPDREPELVAFAEAATAAQVEKLCRGIRDVDEALDEYDDSDASGEEPPAPESWGQWRWNHNGTLSLSITLNAVDGAHLLAALVRAEYERTRGLDDPDLPALTEHTSPVERPSSALRRQDPETHPGNATDLWRNVPGNIAPALVAMADTMSSAVDVPEIAAGAEILIHEVDESASVDEGPELRSAEREEVECGASIRSIGHDHGDNVTVGGRRMGPVLWWGRKRRVPNAALVRTILMRDRTCQAPGCGRSRHLHIHHVKPWSSGGTTDPDNLIMLCGSHHRALHHGAFSIEALGSQRFAFRGTQGGLLITAPLHAAPRNWKADTLVESDGVTPRGGGTCSYGYATEVIYAAWEWKSRQSADLPVAA